MSIAYVTMGLKNSDEGNDTFDQTLTYTSTRTSSTCTCMCTCHVPSNTHYSGI